MKSKQVREFIGERVRMRLLSFTAADIEYCATLAEQEAEARVREELTRWIDPKEMMPEANKNVLVKCSSGEIQTDFYAPELGGFFIEHSTHAKVIGWREMI